MPDKIKITRTLFVGLGGTGVKTILRAKQCFLDAYGEIPSMVAFLAIDTDTAIKGSSLRSRSGKEAKLEDNEICFCGITGSALSIYNSFLSQFQWVPKRNVSFLGNLRNTGAGQVRSNGRFLARYNADEISNRIASKVTEISKPIPIGNRFIYDTNQNGVEYPIRVNVAGSVAGGTGSGTFLDILVLIAKTLQNRGLNFTITPWMVLPEVFRHMMPGPLSANVYQNAYGAIRELDYLYHLSRDNRNALDFGFDTINYIPEGIGETYLINNANKAGVVFQNIDDITDSIGRCMFLPSNEVDSVMDNGATFSFDYNIGNKEAHYVSAGSAEIVYDNKAVGKVIAKGIIAKICNELCKSNSIDAIQEVNAWTTSEAVSIQEHEANLLTDSILPKYAPFSVIIEKDADENTVKAYIYSGAEAPNVVEEIRHNESNKLEEVKAELKKKIEDILNSQNGIGAAISFLESLSDNISICKDEMISEASILQSSLAYSYDWGSELSALRRGPFKVFDKDSAEALQSKITDLIAQKRELLRHNWAIQFFTDLDGYAKELSQKVSVLKSNVESAERTQRRDINAIQQSAKSASLFQIYLHSNDVEHFVLPDVKETSALFRNETPIYTLIDKTEGDICNILFSFAENQQAVVNATNISIEQKMRSMSDEQLRDIFTKVKEMSSPLWSTDPGGYLKHAQKLTTIFTIGVFDQSTSILKQKYINEFTIGSITPTFATTRETDRITFFQTQCYSPAYAIKNMIGYMKDAEEKLNNHQSYPVCYLDEKWNQRMIVEGFDILPKQEKDRVLPNWVNAIVYGFIKFDESRKTYFIESDEQGDILTGGFLELGQRRDLAFDQFQLRGLDKEVESRLQQMILDQGRPAVTAVIKESKSNLRNYVSMNAQLSAIELDRVIAKDPAYQMVRDMLEKEVTYLKELDV